VDHEADPVHAVLRVGGKIHDAASAGAAIGDSTGDTRIA